MINKKIIIGITDCSKWKNYALWFSEIPDVEVIKLTYKENNLSDIQKCDGVVLTGGEDVHPRFYGKPEYFKTLDPKQIDEKRDEFELEVINETLKDRKPLLGICRGLQITNVFFGGTLIPDIPAAEKPSHSKVKGYDKRHFINIFEESLLKDIIKKGRGEINSSHHQSADVVAKNLRVTAVADDGIIEGLEWLNPKNKPFLLLVQWHPERMLSTTKGAVSPFAKNIRDGFLKHISTLSL